MKLFLLVFCLFGTIAFAANSHKITKTFVTVRACDKGDHCATEGLDGAHLIRVQPMYPDAFVGEILSGSFVDGQQVECTISDERLGDVVKVPGHDGDESAQLHVIIFRCKNGGVFRVVKVLFTGVE